MNKSNLIKIKDFFINMIHGLFMALADAVPGVSGGTIAFILGFYDNLINSIDTLTSKKSKEEKKKAIFYLLKLGFGWVIGIALGSFFISKAFEKNLYAISSLFIGFIVLGLILIIIQEKECLKENYVNIAFTILGIAIVFLISYLNPIQKGNSFQLTGLNPIATIFSYLFVLVSGFIAISAMVLPGISGSTILLILGIYLPIINAIKSFFHMDLTSLPLLLTFGLGVILGFISSVKIIKKALEKHRSKMIYLILGLMLGSIYPIIMGGQTLKIKQPPMTLQTFNLIYFIVGLLIILGLHLLQKYLNKTVNTTTD